MKLNKRNKLVYGVGINDAEYNICRHERVDGRTKTVWMCPFYARWSSVLRRCYCPITQNRELSYLGCSISEEWIYFSKFKDWMEQQDWEGKELDKDLLVRGNKIYSAETCLFVDARVNTFIIEQKRNSGLWPVGVYFDKNVGKYKSTCYDVTSNKQKTLGRFDTPKEAHDAWLSFKIEQAHILATQQTDERVSKALIARYENYGNLPKAT